MSGMGRNYGLGDPDCPLCGGLGYIRYDVPEGHPHFGRIFDCECRQARVDAERIAWLRRIGGLDSLADKTFESFNPEGVGLLPQHRENLRMAYERALTYAQNPMGWLIIQGGYGCGKTHLAAAIANRQIAAGNKVIFITVPDLLDHLRTAFSPDAADEGSFISRFEEVRHVPLLILDDLGIESPTPWAVEKLYQILNHRYNSRLPTVITTNHSLEEMQVRLRSRLQDQDVSSVIVITAPDYRRGGVAASQSDLNSLGLYAHLTFDRFDARSDLPRPERDNLRRALTLAREFAASPEGWLILMGDYGCGKTHLAAAIANMRASMGEAVLFVTVPDLLDHLRAAYAPGSDISYDKRFLEIRSAPLLVLDDLGTESATSWAREKLYQIFNYRYTSRLPTVITTAQKLEALDPRLAIRMRDKRLCRLFAILAPAYLGERQE